MFIDPSKMFIFLELPSLDITVAISIVFEIVGVVSVWNQNKKE